MDELNANIIKAKEKISSLVTAQNQEKLILESLIEEKESLQKEIDTVRKSLESINSNLDTLKESEDEYKTKVESSRGLHESILTEIAKSEEKLEDLKIELQKAQGLMIDEKKAYLVELQEKDKEYHKKFSEIEKDIFVANDTLNEVNAKIEEANDVLSIAESSIVSKRAEYDELKNQIELAVLDLQEVKNTTKTLERDNQDQLTFIASNKEVIKGLDEKISLKTSEITSLESQIESKTEEYKSIEQKAFNILKREDVLKAKTAFIKSQYERAGIKWEE